MAEALETITSHMQLSDWLDDLTVRFLLSLPRDELSSMPRLCFQAEEAQWYYEDFIRPMNPNLPSLNLRQFCLTLFKHCPLFNGFSEYQHIVAYEEFLAYKVRVPVRGAILLDESMEKILLVRGWKKGSSWSFPRGKINKDEDDLHCAMREVWEETGFDIRAAGLHKTNEKDGKVKAIEITLKEQHMKLFVIRGVPLDTHFEPKTRKEIGSIQWYSVRDLPGYNKNKKMANKQGGSAKYYMVTPFLGPLKKWINLQQKQDGLHSQGASGSGKTARHATLTEDEELTEVEETPEPEVPSMDPSTDALKRLLSIGTPADTQASSLPSLPTESHLAPAQNSLLSLFQTPSNGASNALPRTPLEQVDPIIPSQPPETPHPQHPRQPTSNLPQPLQSHFAVQNATNFAASGSPSARTSPAPAQHPSQATDWSGQFRSREPTSSSNSQLSQPSQTPLPRPSTHISENLPMRSVADRRVLNRLQQQLPQINLTQDTLNQHKQSLLASLTSASSSANSHAANGPHPPAKQPDVTTTGPRVPDASQLPAPKLSAHTQKLLDAFTSPNSKKSTPSILAKALDGNRKESEHQNALLNLLKTSSSATSVHVATKPDPPSPATSATTVVPDRSSKPSAPKILERTPPPGKLARPLADTTVPQSTLSPRNQVAARQLSLHVEKRKQQPKRPASPQPKEKPVEITDLASNERPTPKSEPQLFNYKDPGKPVVANPVSHKGQRFPPAQQRHSPRERPLSQGSPAAKPPRTRDSHGSATVPQYSILQRPGTSAASAESPRSDVTATSAFQPQLLKRSEAAETPVVANVLTHQLPAEKTTTPNNDTKDQLLALFGKTAPQAKTSPEPTPQAPQPRKGVQEKNALLGLLSTNTLPSRPVLSTPDPPPAPLLMPERHPSAQGMSTTSQQALLDLFKAGSNRSLDSPGPPISPLLLGTPATRRPPPLKQPEQVQPRSRLGSMASVKSPVGAGSRAQTPTTATPTETKDKLLGILNGVVQREGSSGKRPSA